LKAQRRHTQSNSAFALTPSDFFALLEEVAAKINVCFPSSVSHLADQLQEHQAALKAMQYSGSAPVCCSVWHGLHHDLHLG
jgi:hypothetical protein